MLTIYEPNIFNFIISSFKPSFTAGMVVMVVMAIQAIIDHITVDGAIHTTVDMVMAVMDMDTHTIVHTVNREL